jgi:beta-mannosidase
VLLYREGQRLITQARQERVLPARSMQSLPVAELLPAFNDMTFAYRFGPLACDLVVARWSTSSASSNAPQAFYLPDAVRHLQPVPGMTFTAQARPLEGGAHVVTLATNTFLRGVCLQVAGCRCEDAHFWLAPGETRDVNVRPIGEPRPFFGSVTALNLAAPVAIRMSGTM